MTTRVIAGRRSWLGTGRPRINPNHPLAVGLWFYVPSNSPGRGVGTVSWTSTRYGRSLQATTTSSGWAVPIPNLQTPVSEFTFLTVQSASSRAASAVGVGVAYDNSAGVWASPFWVSLMAADGVNGLAAYFHFNDAGTPTSWTMPTTGYFLNDSLFHVYVGTAGVSGSAVYRDGTQFDTSASALTAAITPTRAGPSEVMLFDRSIASPGEGLVGSCPVVAIWTRKLSQAGISMISADPFCLLL